MRTLIGIGIDLTIGWTHTGRLERPLTAYGRVLIVELPARALRTVPFNANLVQRRPTNVVDTELGPRHGLAEVERGRLTLVVFEALLKGFSRVLVDRINRVERVRA